MLIADKYVFSVVHYTILAAKVEMCSDIFFTSRERDREFSRRIDASIDNVRDGVSSFIAEIPGMEHARDRVQPGHRNGGALQSN